MAGSNFGMLANMGIGIMGAASEYNTMKAQTAINASKNDIAQTENRMQKAAQAHRNTMNKMSGALRENSITQKQMQTQDQGVRLSQAIQTQSMQDQGSAAVSAAAAGVAGGSVKATMLGLRRSALNAHDARQRNSDSAIMALEEDRKNVKLATIMGEDISVLPDHVADVLPAPSAASALLGLAAGLVDTYDNYQPKGSKITDTWASWL
ncbi:hypothetical protein N8388_04610 [Octadecabacter sp.]|nr:hypothetical protein [Octadecabacter sp.]